MEQPIDHYWNLRLADLKTALESNNFEVYLANDRHAACNIVLNDLIPNLKARSISWGGSMTFLAVDGLFDRLKENKEFEVLNTFDKSISAEEMVERRRQALLVDLFITGTNAVKEGSK